MSTTVFLAVVAAALLHAVWNALVKGSDDMLLGMTAVVVGHVPVALAALALVPAPAPASWPWIACSATLHVGYQTFLLLAYRAGEFTHVYPIARGSAPLIVAAVSVAFLGVALAPAELVAVVLIGAGLISLGLVRRADGLRNPRAAALAIATGGFIAAYSLVDGTGARLSASPVGYFAWSALVAAAVFVGVVALLRRDAVSALAVRGRSAMLVGGPASFVAYALVIWAFTEAPIALVSALRESSIVFAILIGVVVLGERLDLARLASTMVTVCGIVLLRLAR